MKSTLVKQQLIHDGFPVFRKNGTPVFAIMGGSEDGGDAGGEGGENGGEDEGGDEGESGKNPDGTDKAPVVPKRRRIEDETDPEVLKAEVKRLRGESKGYRESAATKAEKAAQDARTALLEDLAVKLGLKKGDEPQTVETLQKQHEADIKERDAQIRDLRISNALSSAMQAAGARAVARDAIVGSGILKDLDITADSFADDMDEAVEKYLEKHPELKTSAVIEKKTGETGGDFQGKGNQDDKGPKSIDDLRKERAARRASA